jgi:DNA invertase Pin-like site-specific DNA recombinase
MSLDSQEYAIKTWLEKYNISIFKTLKEIGSAYYRFKDKNDPSDLRRILSSCKDKTLVVFEPNRLSRNVDNFDDIFKICAKNRHNIAIVSINAFFDYRFNCNYEILHEMIATAQEESAAIGRRISRTAAYKKSRETEWGKMRNDFDQIVDNPDELKITRLIKLLSNAGSSVLEIRNLVEDVRTDMEAEPFELVEYETCVETGHETGLEDKVVEDVIPIGMSPANIEETFKIYGIRRRRARWTAKDISLINE